jgi:hypothetical protein
MMRRRLLKSIVAVTLILPSVCGAAETPRSAVIFRGSGDCGEWIADRKTQARTDELWVLGFMSGLAAATGFNFWGESTNRVSNEAVFAWLDNFCTANPLRTVATGAQILFLERRFDGDDQKTPK